MIGWGTVALMSLSGIWSNLYAANLQDSLYWASEPSQFWDRWAQDQASRGRCLGFLEGAGDAASGVSGGMVGWPLGVHGNWGKISGVPIS